MSLENGKRPSKRVRRKETYAQWWKKVKEIRYRPEDDLLKIVERVRFIKLAFRNKTYER